MPTTTTPVGNGSPLPGAEGDEAAGHIVRGHADCDAIARDDLYSEPSHLAAQLG